jgi:citronellol/citronellal dehydrogenase
MKRFDLMYQINVRGTFAASQACLPYLKKAENPHILVLSPPPKLDPKWFASHLAYTLSKYGMSMCVLGMSEEFKPLGIGVNALWPRTIIATAAVQNLLGGEASVKRSRKPEIMADAAYIVLTRDSRETTGNFYVDEEVLASEGVTDLDGYALEPGSELIQDLFL